MRKTLLTTLLLLACTLLWAGNVSQREAMQLASRLFGADTPMQLVAAAEGEHPAYYVFNAQRSEEGFVIVSGDDRVDGILGYVEHGRYDAGRLSPELKYWLRCYEEQIAMVRAGSAQPFKAPSHADVDPLVKTQWDQDAPYNNMVPTLQNGEQCATGCVATAMAQILKFWAYDHATDEIPKYTSKGSETYDNGMRNIELPALEAYTFNYSIMQDSYGANETGAAVDEVARLMRYCGQAAKMSYGSSSGAAVDTKNFSTYFGYNRNAEDISRAYYNSTRWDELMYGEIAAGRPVLYSGQAYDGGHAFVCDGFKDGLYHINWGWGGNCDGYFLLSLCNPDGSGAGGSGGEDGYTRQQWATVRLQPGFTSEFGYPEGYDYSAWRGEQLKLNSHSIEGNHKTGSVHTLKANVTNIGTAFVSELYLFADGELVGAIGIPLETGETTDVELHFSLNTVGTHNLKLTEADDGTMELWTGQITIEGHQNPSGLEILKPESDAIVNIVPDYTLGRWVIKGTTMKCEVQIRNNGAEDYDDEMAVWLVKAELNSTSGSLDRTIMVPLKIAAGATETVAFQVDGLEVGYKYWLVLNLIEENGSMTSAFQTYSYPIVEDTSGIKGVRVDAAPEAGTPVFDLHGRRVGTVGDSLPQGLYVVKGKKYLVK